MKIKIAPLERSSLMESPGSVQDIPPSHQKVDLSSMRKNSDRNDRIIINVGGTRHETFRSTLRIYPDTRLGWIALNGSECIDSYDPGLNEYFFDRHPTVFTQIINFYRTGKLHAPADICGPLFEEELQYWGLDEKSMEPCCWSKYTEHRDAQENLKVFDTPLLNPIEEELNIETMYDQQAGKEQDDEETSRLHRLCKQLKPSAFNSIQWFRLKKKIWIAFEDRSPTRPLLPKVLGIVSLVFIVMSVLSLFFHSMVLLNPNSFHEVLLFIIDIVAFTWFIIEFILRFISSPKRFAFITSITNIIDLLCIVTYAIQFSYGFQYYRQRNEPIEVLAAVRLFRLFRFLRLSLGLQILKHALIASSKELFLLILLLIIPVAIFATFTYYIERNVVGTKFKTIPESIWWAIITITTVGYGDMAPLTSFGKVVGAGCAICGVVILSLPVSIIGNNFSLFYHYAQARMKLPKRTKVALAGAANTLVAEQSPDMDSDEEEGAEPTKMNLPQINLGSNPDLNANVISKRFRRERLSLYATNGSRQTARRSKSVGNTGVDSQQRQRNGHGPKKARNESDNDSNSDTGSDYQEVFKPISQILENDDHKNNATSKQMSYDNQSFCLDSEDEINKELHIDNVLSVDSTESNKNKIDDRQVSTTTIETYIDLPETIITDTKTGRNQNLLNTSSSQAERIENSHNIFHTPPVIRRNDEETIVFNHKLSLTPKDMFRSNQMSPDDIPEQERRRSKNHLHVPPLDDII